MTDDERIKWTWAAAIAVEERRLDVAALSKLPRGVEREGSELAWGSNPGVAEAMVLRLEEPERFVAMMLRRTVPSPPPGTPSRWDELADELWRRLRVDLDVGTLKYGEHSLVTPYHVHVATDERHPHYDRRVERPLTPDFVHSLRLVGFNARALIACAHEDLDGVTRLYVKAGRKRTRGARRANVDALDEFVQAAQVSTEPLTVQPPKLLRYLFLQYFDPDTAERLARTDHDHQDAETLLEQAEACATLRRIGHTLTDIADLKGCTHQTVSHLLSLLTLAKELQELLQQGLLTAKAAYRLTRATKKRQLEIWGQVKTLHGSAQLRAIEALLGGEAVPQNVEQRPLPARQLHRLVETFPETSRGTQLHGVRLGLQLAAGDTRALKELTKEERSAIKALLEG